jgi:nucleotide-binding universal stress UspA family protein
MSTTFRQIMVPLDLTSMDTLVIKYASFLAQKLKPDAITFIHIMESYNLPNEVQDFFEDLDEPIEQIIKKELNQEIADFYEGSDKTQVKVQVIEGNPTNAILKEADRAGTDLVIMAKKTGFKGKGILTGKIARLIHCSILILPESTRLQVQKIHVPIDFSKFSQMALRQAISLSKIFESEILAQHIYSIPTHYYPYITPTQNMDKPIEKHARQEYEKFLKKVARPKPNIRCVFMKDEGADISQRIYDLSIEEGSDLIIIGSKGLTDAASYLIGSTAEKLTAYDKTIPLLIFKDKEENYGLLDVLLNR